MTVNSTSRGSHLLQCSALWVISFLVWGATEVAADMIDPVVSGVHVLVTDPLGTLHFPLTCNDAPPVYLNLRDDSPDLHLIRHDGLDSSTGTRQHSTGGNRLTNSNLVICSAFDFRPSTQAEFFRVNGRLPIQKRHPFELLRPPQNFTTSL